MEPGAALLRFIAFWLPSFTFHLLTHLFHYHCFAQHAIYRCSAWVGLCSLNYSPHVSAASCVIWGFAHPQTPDVPYSYALKPPAVSAHRKYSCDGFCIDLLLICIFTFTRHDISFTKNYYHTRFMRDTIIETKLRNTPFSSTHYIFLNESLRHLSTRQVTHLPAFPQLRCTQTYIFPHLVLQFYFHLDAFIFF